MPPAQGEVDGKREIVGLSCLVANACVFERNRCLNILCHVIFLLKDDCLDKLQNVNLKHSFSCEFDSDVGLIIVPMNQDYIEQIFMGGRQGRE